MQNAVGGMAMPALSRHWLHSLLLLPPAYDQALLLQKAVAHFLTCNQVGDVIMCERVY
jgi:hypothetical protein